MAGFHPRLFSTSPELRQNVTDMTRTIMVGGHSDDLDSSFTFLHLSDSDYGTVSFHGYNSILFFYYDYEARYPVE